MTKGTHSPLATQPPNPPPFVTRQTRQDSALNCGHLLGGLAFSFCTYNYSTIETRTSRFLPLALDDIGRGRHVLFSFLFFPVQRGHGVTERLVHGCISDMESEAFSSFRAKSELKVSAHFPPPLPPMASVLTAFA